MMYFICAVMFAVCFMMTPVIADSDSPINPALFVCGLLLWGISFVLIRWITKRVNENVRNDVLNISDKKAFIISFAAICLVGVWYLLVYYPGTGMMDTLVILRSGVISANQHPWLYCTLVEDIVAIVLFYGGNYECALVIWSILQILTVAFVYSYIIVWLKNKQINTVVWALMSGVYIFCPILNLYMITLLKDVIYSLVLLMWVPVLYDYWESNGEWLNDKKNRRMIIGLIVLSLLRNNGIYVTAFILFTMIAVNKKYWKKITALLGILLMLAVGNKAYEEICDLEHLFKETVGIPLQQIAATIYYEGDITEEQLEFIDTIIPVEYIKENYNPYTSDVLKWQGPPFNDNFLNANKAEFLKTWAQILVKNKNIYVEAYLKNTHGFWSLDNRELSSQYKTLYVKGEDEWFAQRNISIKSFFEADIQEKIENIMDKLIRNLGGGTCFWIMVLLLMVLIKNNNRKIIVIAAPEVGAWLTIMLATPVAYQWRYILYIPMTIPIFIGLLFKSKVHTNGERDAV